MQLTQSRMDLLRGPSTSGMHQCYPCPVADASAFADAPDPTSEPGEVTRLLIRWADGDKSAEQALFRAIYSDLHDLSCICVRLGSPRFDQSGDWDPDKRNGSLSPRDCAQLFGCCVDVEDVDFAIVHGISKHRCSWMDLEVSRTVLGYEPQDGTAFPRA